MNPFIKKEIRLLLPAFAIACVLTLANLFFQDGPNSWGNSIWYFVSRVVCPAVAVMLALGTFGEEVSNGTFSMLLAQPVSRLKIWQTKIGLLAGALSLVTLLWVGSFALRIGFISHETHAFKDWLDFFAVTITFGLVVFSGGLWTVLLLRQVAAAFWFTLLMPGVILMILDFSLPAGCFCGRRTCNGRAGPSSCRKCTGGHGPEQLQTPGAHGVRARPYGARKCYCINPNSSWPLPWWYYISSSWRCENSVTWAIPLI
jgi:hypothetical protein